MCAEKVPEHCHRSLIADYLAFRGSQVTHLADRNEMRDHRIDPTARGTADGLVYDRNTTYELGL